MVCGGGIDLSDVSNEEHILAAVTDDQQHVSPRGLEVCKTDSEEGSDEDRGSGDARLERRAQCREVEDHDAHGFRSSLSHAQGHAPSIGWPADGRYRTSEEKRNTFKAKHGLTQSMTFRPADVIKALASMTKICQRRSRVVFDEAGSYIENKASGRRVSVRVESGVYAIYVYVKNFIDTGGSVFAGPQRAKVTCEPVRLVKEVEVPDKHDAGEGSHEVRWSGVEGRRKNSQPSVNGVVDNAVQRVIGLTRMLKDALETNLKQVVGDVQGASRGNHHQQILCGSGWQDTDGEGTRTTANGEVAEHGNERT